VVRAATVATIDSNDRLPATPDDGDEPTQISLFGPAGQLVLPGSRPAQLSLDGREYSPRPPSPDRASRSLGNPHGVLHDDQGRLGEPPSEGDEDFEGRLRASLAPALGCQLQLPLDADAFDAAPQLSMWSRLDVAHDLLRDGDFDRDAKCHRTRFQADADIEGKRTECGDLVLGPGVIRCDKWTCPACGPHRARDVAAHLAVAFGRHLASSLESDVAMLTLTIPHSAAERAATVVDRLFAACADLWRTKEWRRFEKRLGVIGRVRALDAVFGGSNGVHAHFHVALFISKALIGTSAGLSQLVGGVDTSLRDFADPKRWTVGDTSSVPGDRAELVGQLVPSDLAGVAPWTPVKGCSLKVRKQWYREQQGSLVTAWERCVMRHGRIENLTDFRRSAVLLSPSEKAADYFTKWHLAHEIGSPTSKDKNHLRVLDAVAAGVKGAAYTFKEWRRAVDGRAWVTGLADICKRLGVTDQDAEIYLADQRVKREREQVRVKYLPLSFVFRSHLFAVATRLGWERVLAEVNAIDDRIARDGGDLQQELDAFLWRNLDLLRSRDTS